MSAKRIVNKRNQNKLLLDCLNWFGQYEKRKKLRLIFHTKRAGSRLESLAPTNNKPRQVVTCCCIALKV